MFSVINEFDVNSAKTIHIYDMLLKIINETNSKFVNINKLVENKGNIKNYLIATYNCLPVFYITFYGIASLEPIIDELSSLLKIILINEDIHHSRRIATGRIKPYLKSYYSFNTSGYQLNRWNLPNVQNNYYFPHSARWILDINNNPINKVLLSGANSDIYPDRLYAINLKHPKTEVLKKLKDTDKNASYGINFYKQLNKYICCFVDTARDYTLAKIFEICGAGSLLLCMNTNIIDIFEQLGFIDGENYIACTRDNLIEKIEYITNPDNLEEINKIKLNGQNLIKEKHNWEYRYKIFLDVLAGKFVGKKQRNDKYGTDYYLGF